MTIRRAEAADLPEILRIQAAAPEAACWSASSWTSVLAQDGAEKAWIAVDGLPIAFLACRAVDEHEAEILNIAVEPAWRRRGVAQALLQSFLEQHRGDIFLEVRASNRAADNLYRKLGFSESGLRRAYYHSPVEDARVLRRTLKTDEKQPKRD